MTRNPGERASLADTGVRVVLIPGAFGGAWMWPEVAERLQIVGIESRVVEVAIYGRRRRAAP